MSEDCGGVVSGLSKEREEAIGETDHQAIDLPYETRLSLESLSLLEFGAAVRCLVDSNP